MVKKVDEKQRAAIMRQNAINYGNQQIKRAASSKATQSAQITQSQRTLSARRSNSKTIATSAS